MTTTIANQLAMALAVPLEFVVPFNKEWTDEQFMEYQNFLGDAGHIRAVTPDSLKERIAQGVSWEPKNKEFHCEFSISVVTAGRRFELDVSAELIGTGMRICPWAAPAGSSNGSGGTSLQADVLDGGSTASADIRPAWHPNCGTEQCACKAEG